MLNAARHYSAYLIMTFHLPGDKVKKDVTIHFLIVIKQYAEMPYPSRLELQCLLDRAFLA